MWYFLAFEMSPGLSESESRSVEDESIINQHHTKSANVLAEKSANQSEISSTTATTADSAASANAASTTSTSTKEDDSKAAASSSSGGEESREEWPPSGYEIKIEAGTGEQYFVNVFTGVTNEYLLFKRINLEPWKKYLFHLLPMK